MRRLLKRPVLTPLEDVLITTLKNHLSPRAGNLLAAQVNEFNLAQRHANMRETCLYPMKRGRPHREIDLRFPGSDDELQFATIRFEVDGKGEFIAEFVVVEGFLFSIEFRPSAAKIAKRTDLSIKTVTIHHDPFASKPDGHTEATSITSGAAKQSWLSDESWESEIVDRRPPITDEGRAALGKVASSLPDDYLQSLEESDGFRFRDVSVLGAKEVYGIVLEKDSYYVLALVGDRGVIAVRKQSFDKTVNRPGILGGLIPREDGAHGSTEQVSGRVSRARGADGLRARA